MHVITRKRLNEFAEKYPETRTALANWYDLVSRNDFSSLPNLKLVFPTADQVEADSIQCRRKQGAPGCGDPL